jgi:adenosylhomocysteine nucleosidase
VLLLVAVRAEWAALHAVCAALGIEIQPMRQDSVGDLLDLGSVGSQRVFAARTRMGAIRHEGSAYKAILLQRVVQATSIIQTGMAFGVDPRTQRHGDVLVARTLFPYDDRTIHAGADGAPVIDYSQTQPRRAKPALVELFKQEIRHGDHPFGAHVGMLLSGNARIFCGRFRDDLVRTIPSKQEGIIGGDMEGVGLLAVSPPDNPLWAVVKGISDFADEDRHAIIDATRAPACENAIRFVLTALRNNS